ncbi:lipoprotein [Thecamonas trahens ATCC 50062]|uniref:Lipoprotein n=1 Tax=Thecamonas trahens ATCC 50062 TaxID=461836 RepID=A0A0L0DIC3_THETB|nr:lipoprotein [Thecamonas trahens ATCC 50062]KNC52094.1 lipoprotein [Thecamonas trahens ATCC 50062]|eukprot:XP_013762099.1 lipoprotein [Thecamonas trahens ATCC 50062]
MVMHLSLGMLVGALMVSVLAATATATAAAAAATRDHDLPPLVLPCGETLWPDSPDFANATRINNMRFYTAPQVVAVVACAEDIGTALKYAKAHGLKVAIKSGGHSAVGYSLASLTIDLSASTASHFVDAGSGKYLVQAGARWVDVYARLNGSCWQIAGGGCPTVGVGGYTLGGGISFASRGLGLAADQLVAATVVSVDGEVVTVGEDSPPGSPEADLFWALRGGGGGNFVVAYNFTFQLGRAPACAATGSPDGVIGALVWPLSVAPSVLRAYGSAFRSLLAAMPDVSLPGLFRHTPDGSPVFQITVMANEDPDLFYAQHLPAILAALPKPANISLDVISLPAWELAQGTGETGVDGRLLLVKSGVLAGPSHVGLAADILVDAFASSPSKHTVMLWHCGGGAIARVPQSATAFFHRDYNQIYEIKALWNSPAETQANSAWADALSAKLAPLTGGASYVNYIDATLPNWQAAYYGSNYPRLVAVRCEWDPHSVLGFAQGIGGDCPPPPASQSTTPAACDGGAIKDAMAAFQAAQIARDAAAAAALFAPNGTFNVPAGVATTVGRAAIEAGFASFFASLISLDEAVTSPIVVSANVGAFSKIITERVPTPGTGKPCTIVYPVTNWFEFGCSSPQLAGLRAPRQHLPLITSFTAAFNTSLQAEQLQACVHGV